MASQECCDSIKIRLTLAVIGLIIGISVFPVFGFIYDNWSCAIWGLVSGVFALVTLLVHIQFVRDEWRTRSHMLRPLMFVGCFGQLAGVCGFVVYLTLGISQHQGLIIHGPGYFLACVWCFMTWKWSFILFYYSRYYRKQYETMTGMSPDTAYQKI